jgi:hypothetical protein
MLIRSRAVARLVLRRRHPSEQKAHEQASLLGLSA